MEMIILILVTCILITAVLQKKNYRTFIETYRSNILLPVLAPYSLFLVDKLDLYRRFPTIVAPVHQKMIILRGSRLSQIFTRIHLAKIVTVFTICALVTFAAFVSVEAGDYTLPIFCVFMTVILVYAQMKELDTKVKKRKESILLELPEFTNKLILLVNAGETVQGAINKSVQQNINRIYDSPLYYELNEAMNKLQSNSSFQDAMKDFSQRCGIQEVSVLTTTIMMNYRKGGKQLAESLKDLSKSLWDKRKTLTRIKGEEASSKLIFPMIFVFAAVLLVIIYPAITMFNF
ncbi:type II secretion system protein F (GspF) [Salinicoccus halodurans]|uniref:Type II secretion system protein F (GspF) n=1 Tax=Salinicoccus halodurans TaxID=407035 RepID=A0AA94HGA3_9STAP|nr:type II secretion system F family protein [Salinicoccus halodurans]SFK83293.1 type II secretion system protein F (GspF) [Salinicoccus halodurans]